MKRSSFTEEQIAFALQQAQGGTDLPPSRQSTASHRLAVDEWGPEQSVGSVIRRKRS